MFNLYILPRNNLQYGASDRRNTKIYEIEHDTVRLENKERNVQLQNTIGEHGKLTGNGERTRVLVSEVIYGIPQSCVIAALTVYRGNDGNYWAFKSLLLFLFLTLYGDDVDAST